MIRSDNPGTFALALRRPLGEVAGISPRNGALVLAWRTVVNPLAFGNTVVLKPSEEAPVTAGLLVAEIMAEAGFPAGVLNVVTHAPGIPSSGCPGLSRVRPGCTPVMIRTYGWCQRPPRVRSSGVANTVPTPGVTA